MAMVNDFYVYIVDRDFGTPRKRPRNGIDIG
jgi:hypothetical protein